MRRFYFSAILLSFSLAFDTSPAFALRQTIEGNESGLEEALKSTAGLEEKPGREMGRRDFLKFGGAAAAKAAVPDIPKEAFDYTGGLSPGDPLLRYAESDKYLAILLRLLDPLSDGFSHTFVDQGTQDFAQMTPEQIKAQLEDPQERAWFAFHLPLERRATASDEELLYEGELEFKIGRVQSELSRIELRLSHGQESGLPALSPEEREKARRFVATYLFAPFANARKALLKAGFSRLTETLTRSFTAEVIAERAAESIRRMAEEKARQVQQEALERGDMQKFLQKLEKPPTQKLTPPGETAPLEIKPAGDETSPVRKRSHTAQPATSTYPRIAAFQKRLQAEQGVRIDYKIVPNRRDLAGNAKRVRARVVATLHPTMEVQFAQPHLFELAWLEASFPGALFRKQQRQSTPTSPGQFSIAFPEEPLSPIEYSPPIVQPAYKDWELEAFLISILETLASELGTTATPRSSATTGPSTKLGTGLEEGWDGTLDELEGKLRALKDREAQAEWLRSIGAELITSFGLLGETDLLVVLPAEGLIWIAEPALLDFGALSHLGYVWHRTIAGPLQFHGDEHLDYAIELGWQIFCVPFKSEDQVSRRRASFAKEDQARQQAWQQQLISEVSLDSLRPYLESQRWIDPKSRREHRIVLHRNSGNKWPVLHAFEEEGGLRIETKPDVNPDELVNYLKTLLASRLARDIQSHWDRLKRAIPKVPPFPGEGEDPLKPAEILRPRLEERLTPAWRIVTDWIEGQKPERWWVDPSPRRFDVILGVERPPRFANQHQQEEWKLHRMVAIDLRDAQELPTTVFYVHPHGNPYSLFNYAADDLRRFNEGWPPRRGFDGFYIDSKSATAFSKRVSRSHGNYLRRSNRLKRLFPPASLNDLALEALRLGGAEGVLALTHAFGVRPTLSPQKIGLRNDEFVNLIGRQVDIAALRPGDLLLRGYTSSPELYLVGEQTDRQLSLRPIREGYDHSLSLEELRKGLQSQMGWYRLLATRGELQRMIANGDLTEGLFATRLLQHAGLEEVMKRVMGDLSAPLPSQLRSQFERELAAEADRLLAA